MNKKNKMNHGMEAEGAYGWVMTVLFYLASASSVVLFFIYLFIEKVSGLVVCSYISVAIGLYAAMEAKKSLIRLMKKVSNSLIEVIETNKKNGTGSGS